MKVWILCAFYFLLLLAYSTAHWIPPFIFNNRVCSLLIINHQLQQMMWMNDCSVQIARSLGALLSDTMHTLLDPHVLDRVIRNSSYRWQWVMDWKWLKFKGSNLTEFTSKKVEMRHFLSTICFSSRPIIIHSLLYVSFNLIFQPLEMIRYSRHICRNKANEF